MNTRALPYRTPLDRVDADPWSIPGVETPLPSALTSWDYLATLTFVRRVRVDLAGTRSDCGLPDDAVLRLCVRYSSSASQLRHLAWQQRLHTPSSSTWVEVPVEVSIPGSQLSGALNLETILELGAPLTATEPFVATRPGSVLWRDHATTQLEGGAGLLPVAPVSFAALGVPTGAAWYVNLDSADWHGAAMGSLLVLLNTDNHEVARALASSPDDERAALLWDTLSVDILCDLVGRALDDETFPDVSALRGEADEPTLAVLVHSMVRGFLCNPLESVDEALVRLRGEKHRDPSRYRATAQRGLLYPRGVTP